MVIDFKKTIEENKKTKKKAGKEKSKSAYLKLLSTKISNKPIIKKDKPTLVIKKFEPAPYVNRYFKDEIEEAKRSMFFD